MFLDSSEAGAGDPWRQSSDMQVTTFAAVGTNRQAWEEPLRIERSKLSYACFFPQR